MVGAWQHNDFYTDTNYKLLDPYTKKHAALESAAATHLQCFAGRFAPVTSTICKQMALRTPSILLRRSSLLDLYTDSIRRQLSQPNAPHIMQRSNMQLALTYNTLLARKAPATFALCVSKQMPLQNRPAFATKPSTRPLHGHQSP